MNRKMLTFEKISLTSLVYDKVNVFVFPNEDVKDIFSKLDIIKCYLYLILTDTDNASLQFIFICKVDCNITEDKAREFIFEILIKTKIKDCLDLCDNFWDYFNAQNKSFKKQVNLYEIEFINNQNMITIAGDLKKFFEKYKNKIFYKNHKDMKKSALGMNF